MIRIGLCRKNIEHIANRLVSFRMGLPVFQVISSKKPKGSQLVILQLKKTRYFSFFSCSSQLTYEIERLGPGACADPAIQFTTVGCARPVCTEALIFSFRFKHFFLWRLFFGLEGERTEIFAKISLRYFHPFRDVLHKQLLSTFLSGIHLSLDSCNKKRYKPVSCRDNEHFL